MGPRSNHASPRPHRRLLLLAALLGIGVLLWVCRTAPPPPIPGTVPAMDATGSEAAPPIPASSLPPILASTIAESRGVGRMVFLEFTLSRDGSAQLIGAQGARGRAKPSVLQRTPGHIRYDAYDRSGRLTFSGTVPDPLHQRWEHPAEDDSDRIAVTIAAPSHAPLFLRIPGEADAFSLVLRRPSSPQSNETEFTWDAFAAFDLSPP